MRKNINGHIYIAIDAPGGLCTGCDAEVSDICDALCNAPEMMLTSVIWKKEVQK